MQNYGSFLTGKLQPETFGTATLRTEHVDVHWQILSNGKEVIAVNFGAMSIQLAPIDAITLADLLERTVHDFRVTQDAREAAEYELQAGLRDAYDTPYEVA